MTNGDRDVHVTTGVYGVADVRLPTAQEAADADRRARDEWHVADGVLMESAGRAAAMVLDRLFPRGRVVGVAGRGNNGGDLAVMLRTLHAWGRDVLLVPAGPAPPPDRLFHGFALPSAGEQADLHGADVIVDGLLGTGASGPPRDWAAAWIGRMNEASAPVLALDLPSGADATTGHVHADVVHAACTVTFGWPKLGLLLQPARQHCGRLVAVEMGFPPGSAAGVAARAITAGWVREHDRPRRPDAHKSSVGRLLVLAGSDGMAGAAALAVEAALRAGAGLIRVASDGCNREVLQALVPEATFLNRERLEADHVEKMSAVVAGPGLGRDSTAAAALRRTLQLLPDVPAILDADALNVLAQDDADELTRIAVDRPVVITPHAGELSRLQGMDISDIIRHPADAARSAARRFGCVVLLKGQPSLVAEANGALWVNTTGSSDVATAGMGDQLAGTIGAFLAHGHAPATAATLALYLCGRAADLCGLGRSLVPGDVSRRMFDALRDPGPEASELDLPFVTFDQPPRW
ncbi:MAG TPA: NAD(P)H-hydrate dehydratase [Longimicrobiales bacterium]|nr:NAD(P)H-hydrate dehydratase [Longimicrobiales bacterium]